MVCSVWFQLLLVIAASVAMVTAATAENNKNKQLFALRMSASNSMDQWKKRENGEIHHSVVSSKTPNKNMAKTNSVPFYDPHVLIQGSDPPSRNSPPRKRKKLESMIDSLENSGPSLPPCSIPSKQCQQPASINDTKVCITPKNTQFTLLYLDESVPPYPKQIHEVKKLEVHALPVGQGDCTVIYCPNGDNAVLFDCGSVAGGENRFAPEYIRNYFSKVKSITVIISHGDQDHYNYLPRIFPLESDIFKKIQKVITGGPASDCSCKRTNIIEWLKNFKNAGKLISTGTTFGGLSVEDINKNNNFCEDTDIKFHFIAAGSPRKKKNERSIVMQLSRKDNPSTLLFPGDMEGPMAINLATEVPTKTQLKSTHYKIAHHGASTLANKKEWLDAIDPNEAHVSCVYYGSFGHPRCEVIEMLVPKLGTTDSIFGKTHPFTCLTERATSKKKPADITRHHPDICHRLYSTAPVANKICEIILVFFPKYTNTHYYCHESTKGKDPSTAITDNICPNVSSDDDDDVE